MSLSNRLVRLVKLPNSGGISPLNWLLKRFSPIGLARLSHASLLFALQTSL